MWRGTNEGSELAGNDSLWEDDLLVNNPEFGSSGFNALPGGNRVEYGSVNHIGISGNMWSTHAGENYAMFRRVFYDTSQILRFNFDKKYGFSVRCLKD